MIRRRLALGLACSLAVCSMSAPALDAQPRALIGNGTKHARATIEALGGSGGTAQVLLTLSVDAGWHVSWRNPGETGLPTRFAWSLPTGVSVASVTWPVPVVAFTPVGTTHTLEGEVPWLVTFRVDSASAVDRLLGLTLRYGVCRDVCIPEQLTVQGVLPARGTAQRGPVAPALQARLVRDAGTIAARRISPTALCLVGAALALRDSLPVIVADSGSGADAAQRLQRRGDLQSHVFVMNIPKEATFATGAMLLAVRGESGANLRLDFHRAAPGCRTASR